MLINVNINFKTGPEGLNRANPAVRSPCYHSNKGLVTNYGKGGGYKTGGGAHEVLPLRKGGAEKVLGMLKGGGGHNKFWGSF